MVRAETQEPVGQIKTISGAGTVIRGSDFLRAEVGQQIYQKDRIKTGTTIVWELHSGMEHKSHSGRAATLRLKLSHLNLKKGNFLS